MPRWSRFAPHYIILLAGLACFAAPPDAAWREVLSSVGLDGDPRLVWPSETDTAATLEAHLKSGRVVVLTGDTPAARSFGFAPAGEKVVVRSVVDVHQPAAGIIWEEAVEIPKPNVPDGARVYMKERWQGAPLAAGLRTGGGAVLWLAAAPGAHGYSRYPFLPHMLRDLGVAPKVESRDLWVFFDSSYRLRVDIEWFASRWREAGIAGLHIAAWQYWEPDAQRDLWLQRLMAACHRHGINVYAWIEFPHVSEKFWNDHPEWREQTAAGQDAHLDWRKLMNLANADCARAVDTGLRGLASRFDWDGFNLGELYFESLEGAANPARFTPLNADVRRAFQAEAGFDPADLFRTPAPDPGRLRRFLDYRAGLARRLQEEWLAKLDELRGSQPHLDLVLTHIDDRFDPTMRDKLGADSARLLPVAARRGATFLVEDPANLWHLGPQRYTEIARRYQPILPRQSHLAIDINIVERYQDVYPTKQQTGAELFQLVNLAARSFERVALYFESSLSRVDWPFLPAAAAGPAKVVERPGGLDVDAPKTVGVLWEGGAKVDGKPWPALGGGRVWLPAGRHRVEAGTTLPLRLTDLNAELLGAEAADQGLTFRYESRARARARLEPAPKRVLVDGKAVEAGPDGMLALPPGKHEVSASLY